MAYPSYFDIRERRLPETRSERPKEVAQAGFYDIGELRNADAATEIRFDVGSHMFGLPGGESPPRAGVILCTALALQADSQ